MLYGPAGLVPKSHIRIPHPTAVSGLIPKSHIRIPHPTADTHSPISHTPAPYPVSLSLHLSLHRPSHLPHTTLTRISHPFTRIPPPLTFGGCLLLLLRALLRLRTLRYLDYSPCVT